MKSFTRFLSSEIGFFVIITTLLMCLSMGPTVKRYLTTPPDRVFGGLEYYSDDYSIYVANMLQGQNGRWTLLDKHTTEPHQGTIIHDEYLLWGKFVGLFHVDQIKAYHLARLTFGVVLLAVIYLFLKEIFDKSYKRKLAFFLITFSTGFPIIVNGDPNNPLSFLGMAVKEHLDWITEMDVFYRFVALPHYLLGNIFFILGLICFLKYTRSVILSERSESKDLTQIKSVEKDSSTRPTGSVGMTGRGYLLFGALCAIMLALIHPVALVIFMGLLGIYLLIINLKILISTRKVRIFCKENVFFLVTLITSAPVMIFYKYLMTIPPWDHMAAWEGVTQYHIPLSEFAGAVGPTFYLGIVGFLGIIFSNFVILSRVKRGEESLVNTSSNKLRDPSLTLRMTRNGLILLSWIIAYFLLIDFSYPFLHISQVRFTQIFLFIPFGILAVEGIVFISVKVGSFLRLWDNVNKTRPWLGQICLISLIGLIFVNAIPIYYVSFLSKWYSYDTFSEIAYPFKKIVDGYNWLAKNTNPETHVLTAFMAGTEIPYMSGNTVYVGHLWATLNRIPKEKLQYKFLENKMSLVEAKNFFAKNDLKYFFDDYQAASYGIQPQNYSFLSPVFSNNMVTIYQSTP